LEFKTKEYDLLLRKNQELENKLNDYLEMLQ